MVQESGWASAGMDGCRKSRPHQRSIPGSSFIAGLYIDYTIMAHDCRMVTVKYFSVMSCNVYTAFFVKVGNSVYLGGRR